jgi:hypothetical protein
VRPLVALKFSPSAPNCVDFNHYILLKPAQSTRLQQRTLKRNAGIILKEGGDVLLRVTASALESSAASSAPPSTRISQMQTGLKWLQLLNEPANAFLAKIGKTGLGFGHLLFRGRCSGSFSDGTHRRTAVEFRKNESERQGDSPLSLIVTPFISKPTKRDASIR